MRKKWKSRACRILSQPAIRAAILRMKSLRILLLYALLLLLPLTPTVSRAEQTPEPATPIPVSAEDAPTATPTAVPTPTASATPAPTPVPVHSEPTEPTVYALIAGAAVLAIASAVLLVRRKKRN